MMKSDFPQVTRITEARACDNAHLSIRLGVWTDDGQGVIRAPPDSSARRSKAISLAPRCDADEDQREPFNFMK